MNKKAYLDSLLDLATKKKNSLIITLLCNVAEETTELENYDEDSITSEFLTAEQLDTMLIALRTAGFETNSYIDEKRFMCDVLTDNYYKTNGKHNIILNSAQNGTSIGRKSLIPAFCDLYHLCHNNSNAYVVSLCRDKFFSGSLAENFGFKCPASWLYRHADGWLCGKSPSPGIKVISKLNYETSSIGLGNENIFTYTTEMDTFISELSKKYHQDIVVQEFIAGYEVEVPVIIGKEKFALAPMGVFYKGCEPLGNIILDYEERKGHAYHFTNFCNVSQKVASNIEQCAVEVANALGICGLGRIDFRVTEGNFTPYITDIATNPGIHKSTSTFQAFSDYGYTYQDMMTILVGLTLSRYDQVKLRSNIQAC